MLGLGLGLRGVVGPGGRRAAAWSPLLLPGLAQWGAARDLSALFQASDGTTPVAANNDPIGYAGDKTGNGRALIQATTAAKPTYKTGIINGLPTAYCDGGDGLERSGDVLGFALGAGRTLAAVVRLVNPSLRTPVIVQGVYGSVNTDFGIECKVYNDPAASWGFVVPIKTYSSDIAATANPTILIASIASLAAGANAATGTTLRVNGVTAVTTRRYSTNGTDILPAPSAFDGLALGKYPGSVTLGLLHIAEWLVCAPLTLAQMRLLEQYWGADYGIPLG